MKRMLVVVAIALVAACNKPSDEECQAAIENMMKLMGTENLKTDIQGEVRRCRGGSTREAIQCATKAKTLEELHACDFMKVPTRIDRKHDKDKDQDQPGSGSGS